VPGRGLARLGGRPGDPAALLELGHVVFPHVARGDRRREHLARAADPLPFRRLGEVVVAVPPGLLERVGDQLEDPLRRGRDLAARAHHADVVLPTCHGLI
jgi:hypothetical protein